MFASCPNRCFSPVPLGVGDKDVEFDNCIELAVGPYRDARPCLLVHGSEDRPRQGRTKAKEVEGVNNAY